MKIHTDKLTSKDLYRNTPHGCYLETEKCGSRKRDHAFKVGMSAGHGHDSHGIKRCFARNSGQWGGAGDYDRAATWVEWGDWMVALFKIDPNAVIGTYDGIEGFIEETTKYASYRPKRENAVTHAKRWAEELTAVTA